MSNSSPLLLWFWHLFFIFITFAWTLIVNSIDYLYFLYFFITPSCDFLLRNHSCIIEAVWQWLVLACWCLYLTVMHKIWRQSFLFASLWTLYWGNSEQGRIFYCCLVDYAFDFSVNFLTTILTLIELAFYLRYFSSYRLLLLKEQIFELTICRLVLQYLINLYHALLEPGYQFLVISMRGFNWLPQHLLFTHQPWWIILSVHWTYLYMCLKKHFMLLLLLLLQRCQYHAISFKLPLNSAIVKALPLFPESFISDIGLLELLSRYLRHLW